MEVRFSSQAFDDVVASDVWWRENRDAKELFSDEVRAAVLLLAAAPRVGQRIKNRNAQRETRRVVLKRSRFLLFYEVSDVSVTVLRVWHPSQAPL